MKKRSPYIRYKENPPRMLLLMLELGKIPTCLLDFLSKHRAQ